MKSKAGELKDVRAAGRIVIDPELRREISKVQSHVHPYLEQCGLPRL